MLNFAWDRTCHKSFLKEGPGHLGGSVEQQTSGSTKLYSRSSKQFSFFVSQFHLFKIYFILITCVHTPGCTGTRIHTCTSAKSRRGIWSTLAELTSGCEPSYMDSENQTGSFVRVHTPTIDPSLQPQLSPKKWRLYPFPGFNCRDNSKRSENFRTSSPIDDKSYHSSSPRSSFPHLPLSCGAGET